MGLAYGGLDALLALSPIVLPPGADIAVDGSVLLFTLGLTGLTGLGVGVLPILMISGTDLAGPLKEGGKGRSSGGQHRKLQSGLLVTQMALAVLLLTGAGLMIRSFERLQAVDPGFDSEGLVTAQIRLPAAQYQTAADRIGFWDALLDRVRAIPGVTGAAGTTVLPIVQGGFGSSLTIEDREQGEMASRPTVRVRYNTPGFFQLLDIPIAEGRGLAKTDRLEPPWVGVINETAAKRFWSEGDAVGARIRIGPTPDEGESIEIIGVVQDVRDNGLRADSRPALYFSTGQSGRRDIWLVVRANGDPTAIVPGIRRAVKELDAGLPLHRVRTMKSIIHASLAAQRSSTMLLGLFSGVALLLAAVGVYGVMAYTVSRRTHEIAVRMALGARQDQILGLVLGQGARLVLVSVALGVAFSMAGTRVLDEILYEISATDPVTFAVIPLVLGAVAMAASYLPARQAANTDPAVTLQEE